LAAGSSPAAPAIITSLNKAGFFWGNFAFLLIMPEN
jgi:hypothetical protein